MKQYAIYAVLACALTACASGQSATRYYQLPDSAFHAPTQRGGEVAVQVVLAEHLAGESLLYQTDDYHLNFAQKNLWATPLADALSANLANKLNARGVGIFLPKKLLDNGNAPVLKVYFDRFQGTYLGETEISGYAQWANGTRRPFAVKTAQQGDGYDAMVRSLNQGLTEVVRTMVE